MMVAIVFVAVGITETRYGLFNDGMVHVLAFRGLFPWPSRAAHACRLGQIGFSFTFRDDFVHEFVNDSQLFLPIVEQSNG